MVGLKLRKGSWIMRKVSLVLAGALLGATAMSLARDPDFVTRAWAANADTYKSLNLFGDVFERVRADYVEKPEEKQLIENAIQGMISALDPHSSYMDEKRYRDRKVDIRGEFGGLGIEVTMENNMVKVMSPIDDTPGRARRHSRQRHHHPYRRRCRRGPDAAAGGREDARRRKHTHRPQDPAQGYRADGRQAGARRDPHPRREFREEGDVGYVRIAHSPSRPRKAAEGDRRHQQEAPGDKLKGYVLDLRNNPGGLLDQSIRVSMRSSTAARSCRPAAASRKTSTATTPVRAT